MNHIHSLDLLVSIACLAGIVGVGCHAGLKQRKEAGENRYFLAAHSLKWPSIGMALFATNISCVHLVSLAQTGYDQGLLMGNFEWMAGFTLASPKQTGEDREKLHWPHPFDALKTPGWPGLMNHKFLAAISTIAMITPPSCSADNPLLPQ